MKKIFVPVVTVLAGVLAAVPAFAFTHHPSTPVERVQTRDLNLQQLTIAKGQAPANMQANAGTASGDTNQPVDQNQTAPATAPAPNASAPQDNSQAPQPTQPAQNPSAPPSDTPQQPNPQ